MCNAPVPGTGFLDIFVHHHSSCVCCPCYPPVARISLSGGIYSLCFTSRRHLLSPGSPAGTEHSGCFPTHVVTPCNPQKDPKKMKLHYLIGIYFLFLVINDMLIYVNIHVYMCARADILFACSICYDM